MKSVAVFKWAANPEDGRILEDGSVKWSTDKPAVSDDDYLAVEVAKAADPEGEVYGLTAADRDVSFAAARGAKATYAIDGLKGQTDPTVCAHILARAVEAIGSVDLVAIGDTEWEPTVPALVAGLLGWPVLLAVDGVQAREGRLVATRRLGAGTQDVQVTTPVVLGVAARREEAEKPGMKTILKARKLPVETLVADELLANDSFALPEAEGTRLPDKTVSRIFEAGEDLEAAVAQLVEALKTESVL